MIQFRCRCSHAFTVPDDEAGTSLQCPSCGLLVDVPTLEELPGVRDDGTIALEMEPTPGHRTAASMPPLDASPATLEYRAPRLPSRSDAASVDRRLSLAEFLKVGVVEDDLLELKGVSPTGTPVRPKYDPMTGELIRPIDVVKPPAARPMLAQSATLAYERTLPTDRPITIWMPLREMFALPNLVVCGVVAIMCYANMVLLALTFAMFLPGIFVIGLTLMSIAHFANVVDETGPTGTDEMPTPLRGGSLYDDMIRPLLQVICAFGLAYVPIILFNLYVRVLPWEANVGLTLLFFLLVPATLITMTTSGAANNWIPSRMFSVIGAAGTHYWIVTIVGFVATIAFALGLLFSLSTGDALARKMFVGPGTGPRPTMFALPGAVELLLAPIVMWAGVYAMHVFCWQLGLVFRFHHDKFNWVLQKHDKTERNDMMSQLHAHRQMQLEQQAVLARKNFDRRALGEAIVPKSARPKPIDAALAREIPTATPVIAEPAGDVPIARPAK